MTLSRFSHEALFYDGARDYVSRTANFVRDGLMNDEPVLVMVPPEKIDALSEHLGPDAFRVEFVDMTEAGRNPGRIISHWGDFAAHHSGRPARGVGEPIWADRSDDELVECQHHESLLNIAFEDAAGFRLVCPYDTETLPATVIAEARRTHPRILDGGEPRPSGDYAPERAHEHHHARLAPPHGPAIDIEFDEVTLGVLRHFIRDYARQAGLPDVRADDMMLAANEVATNSVRHGGGHGVARLWEVNGGIVCEVRDRGVIQDPVTGRVRPEVGPNGGQGIWLAHQLCDLVQIRSTRRGTVVRLHMLRRV